MYNGLSFHHRFPDVFSTTLFVDIGKVNQKVTFHVMDCGNENVILGFPWLRNANPTIDWDRQTLTIPESMDQSADL
jgi:hypothetical protein